MPASLRQFRGTTFLILALTAAAAGSLPGQSLRGKVLDAKTGAGLPGALIELRDSSLRLLQSHLSSPTGAFQFTLTSPGRYQVRVMAIGFVPRAPLAFTVPIDGLQLPDLALAPVTVRLPDVVVVARQRFCGKTGFSDEVFGQLLESARNALQVIDGTIRSRQVGFQVAVINSRVLYGPVNNFITADTAIRTLAAWPVRSVPADTLQAYGFGRQLRPGIEGSREYYGPDPQVLFSEWFLAGHCFTLEKPKKSSDTLRVRFAPLRKGKQIDIRGELLLDAHNLALHALTFSHVNLPNWMSEEAAGGEMQFFRMGNGLWVSRTWALWAPIAGFAWRGDGAPTVAGVAEIRGFVTRMLVDTTQ